MSVQFVHPSRSKLRAWLAALVPSEKVTVHVESCERCATRLLDLADSKTDGVDQSTDDAVFADVVRHEWMPPADLAERVIRSIDERARTSRDLDVVLGLFGVATETASLMLPPNRSAVARDTEAHGTRDERNSEMNGEPRMNGDVG